MPMYYTPTTMSFCSASALVMALTLFALVPGHVRGTGVSLDPSLRVDVIGRYALANREQCRRLCWYRQMCTSFSFNNLVDSSGGDSGSCLLHTLNVEGVTSTGRTYPGWTEAAAGGGGLNPEHGCRSRPCGAAEVCVPKVKPDGHHCVPVPAMCPSTASVSPLTTLSDDAVQGDVITAKCQQHYVVIPKDVSMNVTCQVNSKFTAPAGECMQAEFVEPSTPFAVDIPWGVEVGWGACVKARYLDPQFVGFNFKRSIEYTDIDFHFAMSMSANKLSWNTFIGGTWVGRVNPLEYFPLALGDSFTLSFKLLATALHVEVRGILNFTVPTLSGGDRVIPMTAVKSVQIYNNVDLDYVNVVSECH